MVLLGGSGSGKSTLLRQIIGLERLQSGQIFVNGMDIASCRPKDLLTNQDETTLPLPWVKWAYQPVRAQDAPGAIMRAYAALCSLQRARYTSIPLDDSDRPALGDAVVRSVSSRYSPDPQRVALFAERIQKSKNPALLYGPEIERSGGWDAAVKFAERLNAPVYITPLSDRASFPQTHPQVSRYGADHARATEQGASRP
jgi:thiamine pyrophosphate-dependent acetolactate synthase large subunit-like protein